MSKIGDEGSSLRDLTLINPERYRVAAPRVLHPDGIDSELYVNHEIHFGARSSLPVVQAMSAL